MVRIGRIAWRQLVIASPRLSQTRRQGWCTKYGLRDTCTNTGPRGMVPVGEGVSLLLSNSNRILTPAVRFQGYEAEIRC